MLIEIKGVQFVNKGAELMLMAMVEKINVLWPEADICLLPRLNSPYKSRAKLGAYQKLNFRKGRLDFNTVSYWLPKKLRDYLKRAWGVVTEADIDLVRKIIQEEAIKLPSVIDFRTPEQVLADVNQVDVRVIDVHPDFIHVRAYVWLNEPFKEFKTKCELKEVVHKRFIKEGISLPIPIHKIISQ